MVEPPSPVAIELLAFVPPSEQLSALVQLVNDAYDVAEDGMWSVKGFRTNQSELQSIIQDGHLIVAKLSTLREHRHQMNGDPQQSEEKLDDRIIGCVKVERLEQEPNVGEWGMLVVDQSLRGQGIGGKLAKAAEDWSRQHGCTEVQLEILTPRSWTHPFKEYARKWYTTRLGYIPLRTEPFEHSFAHLVDQLATPCDFTIYRKPLV